jgi:hypothetical protein
MYIVTIRHQQSLVRFERKSVYEPGYDEAEVQEYLEICRRTPMHSSEQTHSEPGIPIWPPSNDLAPSSRRASSTPKSLSANEIR